MVVKMRFLIELVSFSYVIVLGVISITSAIYLPPLGIITCIGLTAFFFDNNKKVFERYLVLPNMFFSKNKLVTSYHRLLLFVSIISLIVNLMMMSKRLLSWRVQLRSATPDC